MASKRHFSGEIKQSVRTVVDDRENATGSLPQQTMSSAEKIPSDSGDIPHDLHDQDACSSWHLNGRPNAAADAKPLAAALSQATKLIKSARVAVVCSGNLAAAFNSLERLQQITVEIEKASKRVGAAFNKSDRRATATLVGWLQQHLATYRTYMPRNKLEHSVLTASAIIHVAVALDGAYYALLEHYFTCSWAAPPVQLPHFYFPEIAAHSGTSDAVEKLLRERAPTCGLEMLLETWDLEFSGGASSASKSPAAAAHQHILAQDVASAEGCIDLASKPPTRLSNSSMKSSTLCFDAAKTKANPLLAVMWARFQEAARLFSQDGVDKDVAVSGIDQEGGSGHRWDTAPCTPAMKAWRSATREVHLYAFAAPNRAAVAALSRRAPLIEMGAGTGYWARVLRAAGVQVLAFDIAPPGRTAAVSNTYHGRMPCFTQVTAGGPKQCGRYSQHTLLLCYPPPGRSMAADCLDNYRGHCVCVVGEWDGDTGSPSFAASLQIGWRLVERVPLPNWSDSSHDLTVWERSPSRRVQHGAAQEITPEDARNTESLQDSIEYKKSIPVAACAACGTTRKLRRCKHCRSVAYCSSACRKTHGWVHAELHALRFLRISKCLSFRSDNDFECLNV